MATAKMHTAVTNSLQLSTVFFEGDIIPCSHSVKENMGASEQTQYTVDNVTMTSRTVSNQCRARVCIVCPVTDARTFCSLAHAETIPEDIRAGQDVHMRGLAQPPWPIKLVGGQIQGSSCVTVIGPLYNCYMPSP